MMIEWERRNSFALTERPEGIAATLSGESCLKDFSCLKWVKISCVCYWRKVFGARKTGKNEQI